MSDSCAHPRGMASRNFALAASLIAVVSLAFAFPSAAATYAWNNAAGSNWSDASSWLPNGIPGASDVADLGTLSGPYMVTLDIDPAASEVHLEAGAALDVHGRSLVAIGQIFNAGAILNYRGAYASSQVHNLSGGTVQVAPGASIVVGGVVDNDGTIAIGPGPQDALFLADSTVFEGTGTVLLSGSAVVNSPLPRPQTKIWLANNAGHTLSGSGDVWVPVGNKGTLVEDGSQGALLTLHEKLYNWGTVRVSNQATINLDSPLFKSFGGRIVGNDGSFTLSQPANNWGTMDNLNGGALVADGGDLRIDAGVIADGSIERTGSSGAVAIETIATPSNLVVQPGAELRVDGLMSVGVNNSSIENHGTVRVVGTLQVGPDYTGPISLTGDGTLFLDGGTLTGPENGLFALLVNGPGHTIAGCGTIAVNIDNQGTINLDCGSFNPATIKTGTLTNRGIFQLTRGNLVLSGGTIVNHATLDGGGGTIKIQDGATVDNRGGTFLAGKNDVYFGYRNTLGTIVGGTLASAGTGGAFRNVGQATLNGVKLAPNTVFATLKGGTTRATGTSFENLGTIQVAAGGSFLVDPTTAFVQSAGTTELDGGRLAAPGGLTLQGLLTGSGIVAGNLVNAGRIAPDPSAQGIQVEGDFLQTARGQLDASLAGATSDLVGHLDVSGAATLDGVVSVATTHGFAPAAGQTFPVMSFASRSGEFAHVSADPSLSLAPVYGATNLTLQLASTVSAGAGAIPAVLRFYSRGMGFVLELPEAAGVTVRVYDVAGREVGVLSHETKSAGIHTLDLKSAGVAPTSGVYFAHATLDLSGRSEVRTARVVFLR